MKVKQREIKIPIFNHSVTSLTCDGEKAIDYLSDLYNYDVDSLIDGRNQDAICFILRGDIGIGWHDKTRISKLAHEANHATYEVMRVRGLKIDDQEAFCYISEYIFNHLLCMLHEQMEVTNLPSALEDILR